MNIVIGINPKTNKKEIYQFADTDKGFEEAQEKVNKGWVVHMNKTGKKLVKQSAPKHKKASKKKAEGK